MMVFRAIQGFVGGAMIPLAFATGFAFFDGPKAAMATAILGVISTLAPTLGPAIGGWITDTPGLALAVLRQHRPGRAGGVWRWWRSASSRRPSRGCC